MIEERDVTSRWSAADRGQTLDLRIHTASLSHIIRTAAIFAIGEGGEQITWDMLDVIVVDHATESAAPKPPRPREAQA